LNIHVEYNIVVTGVSRCNKPQLPTYGSATCPDVHVWSSRQKRLRQWPSRYIHSV